MLNLSNFANETKGRHMEIDFDKMIKVGDYIHEILTVIDFCTITTEYGQKMVVKVALPESDGGECYMYVNDICAEKIESVEEYLPREFYFTKKLKKDAANKPENRLKDTDYYITCYPQTTRGSVKDYIGKEITVTSMREVETEYGKRYAVVLNDFTEFLTSWSRLYKIFTKHHDEIVKEGGLSGIYVIEKTSKDGHGYCGFSTEPDGEDESRKKPEKSKTVKRNFRKAPTKAEVAERRQKVRDMINNGEPEDALFDGADIL